VFCGHFGPLTSRAILTTERWLGRWTDAVVALGPRGKDHLQHHGIGRRVEVIPPGFDRRRLEDLAGRDRAACRRRFHVEDDRTVLLALGRLARVKGIDILLPAFAACVRKGVRAVLLVAGDGPERAVLESQARALGLERDVRFLGWQHDVAQVIGAADLLVLPSRSEGYPHALIEARAAGLWVLASAVGEVPALVTDGRTGHLVPPGRVNALAARLEWLLTEPERLADSRSSPAGSALDVATEADMVARTCALYHELLSAHGSAGRG
jgi:glycosyltransferase involved in cell wall biosynthesis